MFSNVVWFREIWTSWTTTSMVTQISWSVVQVVNMIVQESRTTMPQIAGEMILHSVLVGEGRASM